jgi:hypothetical protein
MCQSIRASEWKDIHRCIGKGGARGAWRRGAQWSDRAERGGDDPKSDEHCAHSMHTNGNTSYPLGSQPSQRRDKRLHNTRMILFERHATRERGRWCHTEGCGADTSAGPWRVITVITQGRQATRKKWDQLIRQSSGIEHASHATMWAAQLHNVHETTRFASGEDTGVAWRA